MSQDAIQLAMAVSLEHLHSEIRACDLCVRTGHLERAAPRVWGVAPAPFMIVGQAPGIREVSLNGEMYLGPAGQKLRGWMRQAGFADDDFGKTIYMTALTKCFPGRLPGSSKDRAPSRAEQANCRPWLDRQLHLVQPKVIILFGKMAIDTFLGRGYALEQCVGRSFQEGLGPISVTYIPLPHSSGASTWLNDPAHRAQVEEAIERVREAREAYLSKLSHEAHPSLRATFPVGKEI